ncbi:MAG: Fur family transcriptional regulator [Planctomycetota bacterium]
MQTRNTRQRDAIRDVLLAAEGPLSPPEVLERARKEQPGLGIATVYRTLKMLLDEGALHAVNLPGDAARYEVQNKPHHHYFQCQDCGVVLNVYACPSGLKALAPKGCVVETHEVWLAGKCAECAPDAG